MQRSWKRWRWFWVSPFLFSPSSSIVSPKPHCLTLFLQFCHKSCLEGFRVEGHGMVMHNCCSLEILQWVASYAWQQKMELWKKERKYTTSRKTHNCGGGATQISENLGTEHHHNKHARRRYWWFLMLGRVTNLAVYLNPVPELQGEPEDISREKARLAAREVSLKLCFFQLQCFFFPIFWS